MDKQKLIDLAHGTKCENEIHEQLEKYFGKLKKTSENSTMGEMFEFDKFNDNCFVEIKTRDINHDKYVTLFFGLNKLIKAYDILESNPNLRIFYLWNCNDGIYYWEHETTDRETKLSGRTDRGKDERSRCVHIRTRDLKRLDSILNKEPFF